MLKTYLLIALISGGEATPLVYVPMPSLSYCVAASENQHVARHLTTGEPAADFATWCEQFTESE